MTDNPAATMIAGRRQGIYRTFETIERVSASAHRYFEGLVVLVAANFASAHMFEPPFFDLQGPCHGENLLLRLCLYKSWVQANHRAINMEARNCNTW